MTKFFRDGKNTVPVGVMNQFKGHGDGAVDGIHVTIGRTKTAMVAKRNKLKIPTFGTSIHGAAVRRVTTVNHLVKTVDNSLTRM